VKSSNKNCRGQCEDGRERPRTRPDQKLDYDKLSWPAVKVIDFFLHNMHWGFRFFFWCLGVQIISKIVASTLGLTAYIARFFLTICFSSLLEFGEALDDDNNGK